MNYNNITALWPLYKGERNKDDYLPRDIKNPREVNISQKTSAKKAILWLLSKTPHTADEIAEHYALSPELVKFLMQDYIRSGMLTLDMEQFRYQVVRQVPRLGPHELIQNAK